MTKRKVISDIKSAGLNEEKKNVAMDYEFGPGRAGGRGVEILGGRPGVSESGLNWKLLSVNSPLLDFFIPRSNSRLRCEFSLGPPPPTTTPHPHS